jgi:glycosyltransferase involved in cell wall biosynthesis
MKKIKVLQFICPAGFYGAEMWILALAKNLDRNLVDCQLAVTYEPESQDIEISKRFLSLGLGFHQIKACNRYDPMVILKLFNSIKSEKIDIIHTHGYKSDIIGLMAARLAGIKAVATPHGFENARDLKLRLYIRMGCFFLKYFDKVAPLSDKLQSDMVRFKVGRNKIQMIQNGVDLNEVYIEKEKKPEYMCFNKSEKKIVYVGQMVSRKNVFDLIKAFDLLYEKHKNVRLILIGDGHEKELLEKKAKSLMSFSKIDFLGYRNDRLNIMKECNLFSMASSLEGTPRSMMEAMSMGVPVAAYNIFGVNNLIINGKTGLMVDFGDVVGLSRCWETLLFEDEFAAEIALNAKRYIIDSFSAKKMADEYTRLYQEMLGCKN